MFDIKAWAEYIVEWAAKDPYGFLTTVILALTPLFLASAVLSWKLAKMIEAREKEQKKKQKRQENIAKAKRLKKDWRNEQALQPEKNHLENYAALEGLTKVSLDFMIVLFSKWNLTIWNNHVSFDLNTVVLGVGTEVCWYLLAVIINKHTYRLIIPNQKIPNLECSKIQNFMCINMMPQVENSSQNTSTLKI